MSQILINSGIKITFDLGERLRTLGSGILEGPTVSYMLGGRVMRKLGYLVGIPRKIETEISSWSVLVSTILITFDVILRYLFNESIPGGFGINCALLAIMVFFALGQVQADKQNIRVDVFVERFPPRLRQYLEVIVYLFALAFFSILFWGSIEFFTSSFGIKEFYAGEIHVPIYPAKAAVVMGCGLMIIELIKDIVLLLTKWSEPIPRVSKELNEPDKGLD